MDNINNIPLVKSFKSLEICLLLFGYSYNINHSRWLIVFNYSVRVLYLSFAIYLYVNSQVSPAFRIFTTNPLLFIAYRIQVSVQILCYAIFFINNFFYKKHIVHIFRQLNLCDSKFVLLKVYFDYGNKWRKLIFCIVLLSVSNVAFVVLSNYSFGSAINWNSNAIFLNYFVTPFSIYLKLLLYANLCWEIKVRFDRINAVLVHEFDKNYSGAGDGVAIKTKFNDILIISKLYEELSECIGLINRGWGFTSLAFTGVPFTVLYSELFTLFYLLVHSPTSDQIWHTFQLYNVFLVLFYMASMIAVIAIVCNETVSASNRTSVLFHKYISGNYNEDRYDDIDLISLQMHFHRKHFTANGFFNIDARLIFSISAAITTYLVILLQFDVGSTAGDNFQIAYYKT